MYNFSSPTFYKNLQKITDMVRKKYVGPRRIPSPGLHLLHPGDAVLRGDHGIDGADEVDPEDTITDNNGNVTTHTSKDDTIYTAPSTDVFGSDDRHGITVRENSHVADPTLSVEGDLEGNNKDSERGDEDGADGIEVRDHPATKRITRFQGTKHVRVYDAQLTSETHKSVKIKSILKPTTYKMYQNFISDQLKALNKTYFYARKQAFVIHTQICETPQCSICECAMKVHHLKFDPGNFSKYMYSQYPQLTLKNTTSNKSVTFAEDTVFPRESKFKKMYLSRKLVERACSHCVSLAELSLLCTN